MIYLLSKPEKVDEHEEKREDAKSGALTLVPVPMPITCHDIITRNRIIIRMIWVRMPIAHNLHNYDTNMDEMWPLP